MSEMKSDEILGDLHVDPTRSLGQPRLSICPKRWRRPRESLVPNYWLGLPLGEMSTQPSHNVNVTSISGGIVQFVEEASASASKVPRGPARQHHKKSKNGCQRCRLRRVKVGIFASHCLLCCSQFATRRASMPRLMKCFRGRIV